MALGHQRFEALLYELDTVEVIVHHREGIVVHLSLVHQVAHQRCHHLDLSLHCLALLLDVHSFLDVAFDELDEEAPLVY